MTNDDKIAILKRELAEARKMVEDLTYQMQCAGLDKSYWEEAAVKVWTWREVSMLGLPRTVACQVCGRLGGMMSDLDQKICLRCKTGKSPA